jgi:hypothetical protein
MWDSSVIFKGTEKSKQSSMGKKFALSGHPAFEGRKQLVAKTCLFYVYRIGQQKVF